MLSRRGFLKTAGASTVGLAIFSLGGCRNNSNSSSTANTSKSKSAENKTGGESRKGDNASIESEPSSAASVRPSSDYDEAVASKNNSGYAVGDVLAMGNMDVLFCDWMKNKGQSEYSHKPADLEWRILEINGAAALVISAYVLDQQPFNDTWPDDLSWENCSLRKWLNDDVYNAAFSDTEKEALLTTPVSNARLSEHDSIEGPDTLDKLYVLSIDELYRFYPNRADRTNLALVRGDVGMYLNHAMYLRTMSKEAYTPAGPALLWNDGGISTGESPQVKICGVMPIFHVDLNKYAALA